MTINWQGIEVEAAGRVPSGQWGHTEGYISRASGVAAHAEGYSTLASGAYSHAEGQSSGASGGQSHAEGYGTIASGFYTHAEGYSTTASAGFSHAGGGYATADHVGSWVRGSANPTALSSTRAQTGVYLLSLTTGSTSAATLTMDGTGSVNYAAAAYNVLVIPSLAFYTFELLVMGRRFSANAVTAGWLLAGLVTRDTGTTARIVGTVTTLSSWTDSTSPGTVAVTANANNYLQIAVTPSSGASMAWQAVLRTNEMVLVA